MPDEVKTQTTDASQEATAKTWVRRRGRPPKTADGDQLTSGALVQYVDRVDAAIQALGQKTWDTVKKTICKAAVDKQATNDDIALFVYKCKVVGVDPLSGRAHLLPFKNRDDGGYSFAFVQGVELYVARAQKAGDLTRLQSHPICQQDNFAVADVASAQIVHQIKTFPRGQAIGAWCAAQRRGQEPQLSIVFITDIPEGLRQNSPQWRSSPALMLEKTAIKNVLRKLYPDPEIADFPEELAEADVGAPRVVIDATPIMPPLPPPTPAPATQKLEGPAPVDAPKPVVTEPPKATPVQASAPSRVPQTPSTTPTPINGANPQSRKRLSDLLCGATKSRDVTVLRKALSDLTGCLRSADLSQQQCDETCRLVEQYGLTQTDGKWWYAPENTEEV